jgi:hypothetical protein
MAFDLVETRKKQIYLISTQYLDKICFDKYSEVIWILISYFI